MADYEIIPWNMAEDVELKDLWKQVFGDPEELIDAFFKLLPEMGNGFAAVSGGKVLGAAYVITGLSFANSNSVLPLGYVYGVATLKEYRNMGIASRLCRECSIWAKKHGAEGIMVRPAEDSLAGFYTACIGTDIYFRQQEYTLPPDTASVAEYKVLTPSEYNQTREQLLYGKPHLSLSDSSMEYESVLCKSFGGGLFSVNGYPVCAYVDDGKLFVKECLAPEDLIPALCHTVARILDADSVTLYRRDVAGDIYLATDIGNLPSDTVFNLLLD